MLDVPNFQQPIVITLPESGAPGDDDRYRLKNTGSEVVGDSPPPSRPSPAIGPRHEGSEVHDQQLYERVLQNEGW